MSHRVLHILTQRPGKTGSGVTLEAIVARAAAAGWEQAAIFAVPAAESEVAIAGLDPSQAHPLLFESGELDFAIPGMSDVMHYPSRRYSSLSAGELDRYQRAFAEHIARVAADFGPDLIHVHHMWLVSSALRDLLPNIPVVVHCHGTGLRQLALCPELAERVRAGSARNDRFLVLHDQQRRQLCAELDIESARVVIVGAGYNEDIFHPSDVAARRPDKVVYAGKLSHAKGLPWLLDAVDRVATVRPIALYVAGGGVGEEADALRVRMDAMSTVTALGAVSQYRLAAELGDAAVFVLPSMYEGLPLVLIEAAACGCRLVSSDLPGVAELAPGLRGILERVEMPALAGPDEPIVDDLPAFVAHLGGAIDGALDAGPIDSAGLDRRLAPFTWDAVFARIETVWRELVG